VPARPFILQKEIAVSIRKRKGFQLAYPNAAGIDVGTKSHFVTLPAERDAVPVREFSNFTDDLNRLSDWIQACAVDMVPMESTGGPGFPTKNFRSDIAHK
jgi:hypothetical protein